MDNDPKLKTVIIPAGDEFVALMETLRTNEWLYPSEFFLLAFLFRQSTDCTVAVNLLEEDLLHSVLPTIECRHSDDHTGKSKALEAAQTCVGELIEKIMFIHTTYDDRLNRFFTDDEYYMYPIDQVHLVGDSIAIIFVEAATCYTPSSSTYSALYNSRTKLS